MVSIKDVVTFPCLRFLDHVLWFMVSVGLLPGSTTCLTRGKNGPWRRSAPTSVTWPRTSWTWERCWPSTPGLPCTMGSRSSALVAPQPECTCVAWACLVFRSSHQDVTVSVVTVLCAMHKVETDKYTKKEKTAQVQGRVCEHRKSGKLGSGTQTWKDSMIGI